MIKVKITVEFAASTIRAWLMYCKPDSDTETDENVPVSKGRGPANTIG